MTPFRFQPGRLPVLISMPHVGTHVPDEIADAMTPAGRAVPDTDWWVDRLYAFAADLGCAILAATHSRFVIDLNRAPDGRSLYPGASNTELVPTSTFRDEPIWRDAAAPDAVEIARRLDLYWNPYHDQLATTLQAMREAYGVAVLFDAHSIASVLSRFFEGRLTDINLGTGGGTSCDAGLADTLLGIAEAASGYTAVLNGRFKGGYITRAYGRPDQGVHAVQLELSFATYLEERPPWAFLPEKADRVTAAALRPIVSHLIDWASAAGRA